ncbi:hypothetical protein D3C86_1705530 [compost metagenome]
MSPASLIRDGLPSCSTFAIKLHKVELQGLKRPSNPIRGHAAAPLIPRESLGTFFGYHSRTLLVGTASRRTLCLIPLATVGPFPGSAATLCDPTPLNHRIAAEGGSSLHVQEKRLFPLS